MKMARCKRCGNLIPSWANGVCYNCVRGEREHGGRPLPPVHPPPPPPAPPSPRKPSLTPEQRNRQRRGINNLLRDIYGKPMYLSVILRNQGFSSHEVQRLKRCMPIYYDQLQKLLCNLLGSLFSDSNLNLLKESYSLDGRSSKSMAELGRTRGYTIRQLSEMRRKAIGRLRVPSNRSSLESLVGQAAQNTLNTKGAK